MSFIIRPAKPGEYERVRHFYYDLIDDMRGLEYHPKWQKGIYPEDSYLEETVRNGEMYLTMQGGTIVGAMVLNHNCNDGYKNADWTISAQPSEVMVIHTLAVSPAVSRQGIGCAMVQKAIDIAMEIHQKTIRLDVLHGNLPALRLYEKAGFSFVGSLTLFYEDTGWCQFELYEYIV